MAQTRNLFTDVAQSVMAADARTSSALERIKKRKTVSDVRVVRVEHKLLADTKEPINVNVFAGKEYSMVLENVERRSAGDYSWIGKVTGNAAGSATFVVHDGNVTGMIRPGNEIYSVEPLGGGLHAIIKLDPRKFPPDHPPSFERKSREPRADAIEGAPKLVKSKWWHQFYCKLFPKCCVSYIDVIVGYTPSAKAQVADIDALVQLAVDEANQSYVNSDIKPRLRLVHKYEVSYTESGDFDTDSDRFRTPGDGFMDEVHTLRDAHKADVAVLIFNDAAYCGLASAIMATATTAFAVVHYDCATGYYSFAHEIGHLQGARHDCAADSTTTPFQYGHGYVNAAGGWRTIMAYNSSSCAGGSCTRKQFWSNPAKLFNGISTGTACSGGACCANNSRVLNETAATVAAFR